MSQKRITRLTEKLAEMTARNGVCLDDTMSGDLEKIMKDEDQNVIGKYPKDSFLRLFREQQRKLFRSILRG